MRQDDSPSLHDGHPWLRMSTFSIPSRPSIALEPLSIALRQLVHLQLRITSLLRVIDVPERESMLGGRDGRER